MYVAQHTLFYDSVVCLRLLQKFRSQLQAAATKDEALTMAIGAAENLMKALKLSSDPNEKKQLKAQCGDIMNVAGRIKNDTDWKPSVERRQIRTKNEQIGQWAAEVVSAQSSAGFEETASQSSLSRHGLSSTTAPVDNVSVPSGKFSASSISLGGRNDYVHDAGSSEKSAPVLLIDLSDDPVTSSDIKPSAPTDTRHEDRPDPISGRSGSTQVLPSTVPVVSASLPSPAQQPNQGVIQDKVAPLSPSTASYSHIRRLAEPVSTRRRSKREDIILLKASMVNGFKCPPWDKNPSPAEFMPQQDVELFT